MKMLFKINQFSICNKNKVLSMNLRKNFYKFPLRTFAIPLSFKNKINSFYKYVHPDVLGATCPNDIRKENERSVQELNSYLDCLDQGTKFDNKNLTFYLAIEQKNKKEEIKITFPKLEIRLEEIKPQISQSNRVTIQLNLNNRVEEMVGRIKRLQQDAIKGKIIDDNLDKKPIENTFSSSLEDSNEECNDQVKILKDDEILDSIKRAADQNYIKHLTHKKLLKDQRRKLAGKIDRAINSKTDFFENRIFPDPLAVQIVNSLQGLKDIRYFGDNFFPTSMIFFEEKLNEEHINTFISKMKMNDLKGHDKYMMKIEFRKIATEMCNHKNLIRLFISDFYSFEHMPGYMTIPYNFEFKDVIEYYNENKVELHRIKNRFVEENKNIDLIKNVILNKFKFKLIRIIFGNNNGLNSCQDVHIGLKKLNKILTEKYKEINFTGFELKLNMNKKNMEVLEPQKEIDNLEDNNYFVLQLDIPVNEKNVDKAIEFNKL